MGKRGHLPFPLLGNIVKRFCALVVTAKHSVDKLFTYYFYNLSSASGGFDTRPHRAPSLDSTGGLSSPDPNLSTSGKKILWAPTVRSLEDSCKLPKRCPGPIHGRICILAQSPGTRLVAANVILLLFKKIRNWSIRVFFLDFLWN